MNRFRPLAVFLLLFAFRVAAAEEKPATPAPEVQPMDRVLPEVNFDNLPLEDVVEFLQGAAPGFSAAVVRDTGVPDGYPLIKLKLKNVRVGDLWMLLQMAYPHVVEAQPVQEDGGPRVLFLVQVHNPPAGAMPTGAGGVKVYRLAGILDAHAARNAQGKPGPEKKEYLNHVLSLVKAALTQVAGKIDPVLQVHEETETLVFKGTAEQRAAVQEVLDALDPSMSPVDARVAEERRQHELTAEFRDKAVKRADEAAAKLQEVSGRLAEEQRISQERAMEVEKLKVRLEESQKIDKAKAAQQARAATQDAERQQAQLVLQLNQLTHELEDVRKQRAEAERGMLERAMDAEKLKIRLEEALKAAEKAANQTAPRPAPTKE